VAALLEEHGITAYCVDAGGDMIQRNSSPLRVGLEHPNNMEQVIGIVELSNRSLCGSSGNRRKWQNFHHIIDPKKLASPTGILAVWVIADTTILADGLTTCLFFVTAEKLKRHSFEYLLVRDDLSIEKSGGFILETSSAS
jgi:thiamine biosynthesis lipoprotein